MNLDFTQSNHIIYSVLSSDPLFFFFLFGYVIYVTQAIFYCRNIIKFSSFSLLELLKYTKQDVPVKSRC